jgi:hypothetical protein
MEQTLSRLSSLERQRLIDANGDFRAAFDRAFRDGIRAITAGASRSPDDQPEILVDVLGDKVHDGPTSFTAYTMVFASAGDRAARSSSRSIENVILDGPIAPSGEGVYRWVARLR